jgi:hypothetical protein
LTVKVAPSERVMELSSSAEDRAPPFKVASDVIVSVSPTDNVASSAKVRLVTSAVPATAREELSDSARFVIVASWVLIVAVLEAVSSLAVVVPLTSRVAPSTATDVLDSREASEAWADSLIIRVSMVEAAVLASTEELVRVTDSAVRVSPVVVMEAEFFALKSFTDVVPSTVSAALSRDTSVSDVREATSAWADSLIVSVSMVTATVLASMEESVRETDSAVRVSPVVVKEAELVAVKSFTDVVPSTVSEALFRDIAVLDDREATSAWADLSIVSVSMVTAAVLASMDESVRETDSAVRFLPVVVKEAELVAVKSFTEVVPSTVSEALSRDTAVSDDREPTSAWADSLIVRVSIVAT